MQFKRLFSLSLPMIEHIDKDDGDDKGIENAREWRRQGVTVGKWENLFLFTTICAHGKFEGVERNIW